MPYDCGTKSFGVNTVYDSGDFPALFAELLRRLDYDARARRADDAERAARGCAAASGWRSTSRRPASARSRPTQVEARADGTLRGGHRRVVDGPGAGDRARADPRRGARACRAARFDVRHADTAAVESGVGTYGSRGTVTAGNAAALAAAEAHRRGAHARRRALGVAETEVTYAGGVLEARAAASRWPSWPPSAGWPPAPRSRCPRSRTRAARARSCSTSTRRPARRAAPRRRGRRRRPRRESRAGRRPARGRRRVRHRQHAAREPRLRRRRPAALRHADGLRAAARPPTSRRWTASTRRCGPRPIRSACAASASAATPGWGAPSPTRCATRSARRAPGDHRAAAHAGAGARGDHPGASLMRAVDRLEVQVLVDNVTDCLSTTPQFVTPEWPALVRPGMRRARRRGVCCANHGLSLVLPRHAGGREHMLLFDAGPVDYAWTHNGDASSASTSAPSRRWCCRTATGTTAAACSRRSN